MEENAELEDIEALLNRHTADGPGEEEVPAADFVAFATEGVERKVADDNDRL